MAKKLTMQNHSVLNEACYLRFFRGVWERNAIHRTEVFRLRRQEEHFSFEE